MSRILLVQTLGSLLVPISLVLAEIAVHLLNAFPWSVTAWYLHLSVFAPLEQVRAVPSPLATLLDHSALTELLLLLLLTVAMQAARLRFGVAIIAHLGFAASLIVARAWILDSHGLVSPCLLRIREVGGTCLVAVLLVASGLSSLLCHLSFIVDIAEARSGRSLLARAFAWLSPQEPSRSSGARGFSAVTGPAGANPMAPAWTPRMYLPNDVATAEWGQTMGMNKIVRPMTRAFRRCRAVFVGLLGLSGRVSFRPVAGIVRVWR